MNAKAKAGLGWGTLAGLASALLTAATVSFVSGTWIVLTSGNGTGEPPSEQIVDSLIIAAFIFIAYAGFGGAIGAAWGGVLGLALGATGTYRRAPLFGAVFQLAPLLIAAIIYPPGTVLGALLYFVGAIYLVALGFGAGVWLRNRLTTGSSATTGRRREESSSTPSRRPCKLGSNCLTVSRFFGRVHEADA